MGRKTSYLESAATENEDSYEYRVEWDDHITVEFNWRENITKAEHHGSGSRDVSDFDNAWDLFNDYCSNPDYKGVRLIQIAADGTESTYAVK